VQEKFQKDLLSEMRLRAFEEKSEERRRKQQQTWRKGVERQLEEIKEARQALN